MRVRPARLDDAPQVTALWNGMIRDTLATFTSQEKTLAGVAALITERQGSFWVIEAQGVQGFVTYGPFRAGPGYAATVEHTVIVAAAAQGKGAGRLLMQQALSAAASQRRHVMVAAISGANPTAAAFHARLGFEQTGYLPQVGYKAGQWLDLILMQKTLVPT